MPPTPWYKQPSTWAGALMIGQIIGRFVDMHGTAQAVSVEALVNGLIAGLALIIMREPLRPKA